MQEKILTSNQGHAALSKYVVLKALTTEGTVDEVFNTNLTHAKPKNQIFMIPDMKNMILQDLLYLADGLIQSDV